jgi:hypothetical protein
VIVHLIHVGPRHFNMPTDHLNMPTDHLPWQATQAGRQFRMDWRDNVVRLLLHGPNRS